MMNRLLVKPIKIKGYFKSTVNSGDSCVIFGLLQKYSSLQNDYTDEGVFYKSFTSNVTTWTSFESLAALIEWTINGFPPRGCKFFRGSLLDPPRAGIIAIIFITN